VNGEDRPSDTFVAFGGRCISTHDRDDRRCEPWRLVRCPNAVFADYGELERLKELRRQLDLRLGSTKK
jgi:hypothetical protein